MKVKVLASFCVSEGREALPGDIINLPTGRALIEIQRGRVKALEEPAERQIENRDPTPRK
jgi:hypothetical protein